MVSGYSDSLLAINPQVPPPEQAQNLTTNSSEGPVVPRVIPVLLFLLACIYLVNTFILLAIILTLDGLLSRSGLISSFFKLFPGTSFIPLITGISTLLFFYVSFKVTQASKKAFLSTIGVLTIVPILEFITRLFLLSPITKLASEITTDANSTVSVMSPYLLGFFFGPIFLFSIVIVILLLFSRKRFELADKPLSKKVKIFLLTVVVITVLPSVWVVTTGFIKTFDRDFGYEAASSAVNFKIYTPTSLPQKLDYATKFETNKELAGKQNAVQVAFDTPFNLGARGESQLVVMKQVGVPPDFDLYSFSTTVTQDSDLPKQVSFSKAKEQTAYTVEKDFEKVKVSYLSFITPDNVLILIASPNIGIEEIISFALLLN